MSESNKTNDEELISDLLLTWEERRERGEVVSPVDLCPDRPDLVPTLAGRIKLLQSVSWVKAQPRPSNADRDQPLPPSEPLAGRYRLDALIGEGGFGRVWQGYDLQLLRTVAVKVPLFEHIQQGTGGEDTFLAEARRVARLAHPGIVPVFDVGRHEGRTFIVSELIDGEDLGRRMKTAPVPVRESVRIVAEAARHLDHAHREGFVHRDVKPANILIGRDGRVYVSDFGIASTAEAPGNIGGGSGTPAYMAPERFGISPAVDVRSDIYGLGVVLYELLTGRLPFDVASPNQQWATVLANEPISPRSLNPAVPETVERACLWCLSKRLEARPANAQELADALTVWLTGVEQRPERGWIGRIRTWLKGTSTAMPPITAQKTPESKPVKTWVGQKVIFKQIPHYLDSLGNDMGAANGSANCLAHEVSVDAEEWIKIGPTTVDVRVRKDDVVLASEAIDYFTRWIRRDAKNPDHYLRRSIAFQSTSRAEQAVADCDVAIRLVPDSPRCFVIRGWAWGHISETAKMIDDMTRALRLQEAAWTWAARGEAWLQIGDCKNAESDLSKAIELDPKCAYLLIDRGRARWKQGKHVDAHFDYDVANYYNPNSANGLFHLGTMRHEWKCYRAAVDYFTKAIQLHSGWHAPWASRGEAYYHNNQLELALADYNESIRLNPNNIDAIFKRALMSAEFPDNFPVGKTLEESMAACEKCDWKEPSALLMLAITYAELKQYGESEKCLRRALTIPAFEAYEGQSKKLLAVYQRYADRLSRSTMTYHDYLLMQMSNWNK